MPASTVLMLLPELPTPSQSEQEELVDQEESVEQRELPGETHISSTHLLFSQREVLQDLTHRERRPPEEPGDRQHRASAIRPIPEEMEGPERIMQRALALPEDLREGVRQTGQAELIRGHRQFLRRNQSALAMAEREATRIRTDSLQRADPEEEAEVRERGVPQREAMEQLEKSSSPNGRIGKRQALSGRPLISMELTIAWWSGIA